MNPLQRGCRPVLQDLEPTRSICHQELPELPHARTPSDCQPIECIAVGKKGSKSGDRPVDVGDRAKSVLTSTLPSVPSSSVPPKHLKLSSSPCHQAASNVFLQHQACHSSSQACANKMASSHQAAFHPFASSTQLLVLQPPTKTENQGYIHVRARKILLELLQFPGSRHLEQAYLVARTNPHVHIAPIV